MRKRMPLLAAAALICGCSRSARDKFLSGVDAVETLATSVYAQTVRDAWALARLGSFVGGGRLAAPPAGSPSACQGQLAAAGLAGGTPGPDGYYAYANALEPGIAGQLKLGFQNGGGSLIDFCASPGAAAGFRTRMDGVLGFGSSASLDAVYQGTSSSLLSGVLTGKAQGRDYRLEFQNCLFPSLAAAAPVSGTWSGVFSQGTEECALSVAFTASGGRGELLCEGDILQVAISTDGSITVAP